MDDPFCGSCFRRITLTGEPLCPLCGTPFAGTDHTSRLCGECIRKPPPYSRARTIGAFNGPLLEAIHLFKYRNHLPAGERLGSLMARWSYDTLSIADYDRIIPVPLHAAKLKERGFNQSLVLARRIARFSAVPVDALSLQKIAPGHPQVGLGRDRRRENVRGTFALRGGTELEGLKVLLVDDVYTTGSTVRECTHVLMKSGVREVAVLALARA
ncbi:MAG: ComF family protein [Syntrophales bacterium]|jgi:ComF family protein|nr:ComF family protein [Syntrophales bacterium]MCK9527812.1 ComF family protein [Syntrophales bacterium]